MGMKKSLVELKNDLVEMSNRYKVSGRSFERYEWILKRIEKIIENEHQVDDL